MERLIETTADGSKTIRVSSLNETYHSHNGALQEARHVFIENGINLIKKSEINILEMGFGTGLNALVTAEWLLNHQNITVNYFGIEKYPVSLEEIEALNYSQLFENEQFEFIENKIHSAKWNNLEEILSNFNLKKIQADFYEIENLDLPEIDLVYFDCFGAAAQPYLWEKPLAEIVAKKISIGGLLITYASKGSFRRVLKELGFEVTKRPGPPGKREMMTAVKTQ